LAGVAVLHAHAHLLPSSAARVHAKQAKLVAVDERRNNVDESTEARFKRIEGLLAKMAEHQLQFQIDFDKRLAKYQADFEERQQRFETRMHSYQIRHEGDMLDFNEAIIKIRKLIESWTEISNERLTRIENAVDKFTGKLIRPNGKENS
jgi:hypothetical protein